ncbi:hypothetical protein M3182_14005 [Mesobacillus maritimus]|uniref:hypothetical protein n=1 Tax=Mesobacillus maritimus TaxID=1643336 RepID=UPI00203B3895|nr:hypothetical protein [Mesobacillus maritimus]MCM3586847.1 hypothetical protein [Mesobacillus maritimus]MCM3668798.1 hypothetical protein [Mesobacillus maritimus]
MLKVLLAIFGTAAAVGVLLLFYKFQLGAISFALLSVFCFVLSVRLFRNSASEKQKKEDSKAKSYKKAQEP